MKANTKYGFVVLKLIFRGGTILLSYFFLIFFVCIQIDHIFLITFKLIFCKSIFWAILQLKLHRILYKNWAGTLFAIFSSEHMKFLDKARSKRSSVICNYHLKELLEPDPRQTIREFVLII